MKKFRISIIDFMLQYKKFEVGKYADGTPACLGDVVERNGENSWFISYRYGNIVLKQPGTIFNIMNDEFNNGDFSSVTKTNIFGSGVDWLIIGKIDEPFYEKVKHIEGVILNEVSN